jgi:hypothetical protein
MLILVAGCDQLFGLQTLVPDDGQLADADGDGVPSDAACVLSGFSGLVPLAEFDGVSADEPTLRADQLEMLFTHYNTGVFELWYADRSDTASPFSIHGRVSFDAGHSDSEDPALSADGLLVVFRDGNTYFMKYATRATKTSPWSNALPLPGLETTTADSGLDLSPDGKTVWFADSSVLHVAHRTSVTGSFGLDSAQQGAPLEFPTVSADGREIFLDDPTPLSDQLIEYTRTNLGVPFGAAPTVTFPGPNAPYDPDLTPDGMTIVVATGNGISIAHRFCQK